MKIAGRPELMEHLAASWALGTLRGGARRRLEAMSKADPALGAAMALWESRMASINELQAPIAPPPGLWSRVEAAVAREAASERAPVADPAPEPWSEPKRERESWLARRLSRRGGAGARWGGALGWGAGAAVLAALALVAIDMPSRGGPGSGAAGASIQARARPTHGASLGEPGAPPQVEARFDVASGAVWIRRAGAYGEAPGKSLQLWAIGEGGAPKSLGVMGPGISQRLMADPAALAGARVLAVSLEALGGTASEGGPKGPVLWSGPVGALAPKA